jgi:2-aminobenzoate-CoA ligase
MGPTAHVDTFARDRMPPPDALPDLVFELPELQFPPRLNAAAELLDAWVARGEGHRPCVRGSAPAGQPIPAWTYAELRAHANRIAHVLVREMGLVPGNRVLLRGANSPWLAACWFAVVKAGGIVVATMPQLRARELATVIEKARISHALCEAALAGELAAAQALIDDAAAARGGSATGPAAAPLRAVAHYGGEGENRLEALATAHPTDFPTLDTAAEDIVLIAFTSGTTGTPKGTMHTHRDLMAACACWPRHVLRPRPDDVFIGSPPLAFTFGLGGLLLFPLTVGASTVLLDKVAPDALLAAIDRHRATTCFTAPTSYRAMATRIEAARAGEEGAPPPDLSSLRQCVSAGEALPPATRQLWKDATGIEIIDGIGSTELFHIFISDDEAHAVPGATGRAVPGYRAQVLGDDGRPLPPGHVGRLAVQGPTGCKYLDDPRQSQYVQDGWNLTGDAYLMDDAGRFFYQARTDDMIVSGGYNIAGPEVEAALLLHPAVAECGVVGEPDEARGMIVKAIVVLRPGHAGDAVLTQQLQDFVKQTIAPYKYPRAIDYRDSLPRTETGKLQRFRLRSKTAAAPGVGVPGAPLGDRP